MKIAVITGASSGIGREFALQIDAMACVDEIWMLARRKNRMENLALQMRTKTRILPMDLTETENLKQYRQLLSSQEAQVEFLVNCAGFGKFGSVSSQVGADIEDMIRLNITALVMMCKYTLPFMLCGGKIINMASVSGFSPLPYLNVYSATKAFVLHFSRALGVETAKYGISVTAVCPYWMHTEFISVARDTPENDAVTNFMLLYEPAPVAAKAIADSLMGKAESVYGTFTKSLKYAAKAAPVAVGMQVWNAARRLRKSARLVPTEN